MDTIRAIVFDWGGVLIENPAPYFLKYCAAKMQAPEKELYRIYEDYVDRFESGAIEEEQMWQEVSQRLHLPVDNITTIWYQAFEASYRPRPSMFELAQTLQKNGYITAMLSNTEKPSVRFFHSKNYSTLFNPAVFSCEEGMRKPQPQIYQLLLRRLGLSGQEVAFIDDKPENIEAARAAGIHGIVFESEGQVRQALLDLNVHIN